MKEPRRYYSQHGEDYLLDHMLKQSSGFFVEVGCIDGRRFSNTLVFEEMGWKGVCVEAHQGYIELLRKNRPQSVVFECAIGDKDSGEVTFWANSRGSLSTLDPSREQEFRERFGEYFTGFVPQTVRLRTLTSVLEECNAPGIDILSVDIEGEEVAALRGLDLDRFKPRIMVIESDQESHERDVDAILAPAGYVKAARISRNIFYAREADLCERARNQVLDCVVTHTRHPLDTGEDREVKVRVDTRSPEKKNTETGGIWQALRKPFSRKDRR